MLRIGFYLMGEKGLASVTAMVDFCTSHPDCIITFIASSKDKAVVNDYFDEIKSEAISNKIPFFEREQMTEGVKADMTFAIGWRWLIKSETENLIVFHDSLLPKYRGFNPLVTALIEGDREIGVTAIRANKEFDKGNIFGYQKAAISYPIKIKEAIEKVSTLYAALLIKTVSAKIEGKRTEIIQDESKATYSLWRDDEDYHIDWHQPADRIIRFINAVGFPYKGAFAFVEGKKIIIDDVEPGPDYNIINPTPGKLLMIDANIPTVVCGKGTIRIMSARSDQNEKIQFNKLRIRLK